MINILEAVIFEGIWGESIDENYDWTRVFNVLVGVGLIITIPTPFKKSITKKFYFFDTESRYTDYIIDFGGESHWFWQISWISLYSSWNWLFVTRYYGYISFWPQMAHVFPPLIRSYFYRKKRGAFCGIWLQSRTNALIVYLTFIILFRGYLLESKRFEYKAVQHGLPLMIWSVLNFICAGGYCYWWLIIKQKQLQTNNDNVDYDANNVGQSIDINHTVVAVELNHDQFRDQKSIQITGN